MEEKEAEDKRNIVEKIEEGMPMLKLPTGFIPKVKAPPVTFQRRTHNPPVAHIKPSTFKPPAFPRQPFAATQSLKMGVFGNMKLLSLAGGPTGQGHQFEPSTASQREEPSLSTYREAPSTAIQLSQRDAYEPSLSNIESSRHSAKAAQIPTLAGIVPGTARSRESDGLIHELRARQSSLKHNTLTNTTHNTAAASLTSVDLQNLA